MWITTPAARQSKPLLSAIASTWASWLTGAEAAVRAAVGAVVVVVAGAAGVAVVAVDAGVVAAAAGVAPATSGPTWPMTIGASPAAAIVSPASPSQRRREEGDGVLSIPSPRSGHFTPGGRILRKRSELPVPTDSGRDTARPWGRGPGGATAAGAADQCNINSSSSAWYLCRWAGSGRRSRRNRRRRRHWPGRS